MSSFILSYFLLTLIINISGRQLFVVEDVAELLNTLSIPQINTNKLLILNSTTIYSINTIIPTLTLTNSNVSIKCSTASDTDYCQLFLEDSSTTTFNVYLIGTSQISFHNILINGQNANHNIFNVKSDSKNNVFFLSTSIINTGRIIFDDEDGDISLIIKNSIFTQSSFNDSVEPITQNNYGNYINDFSEDEGGFIQFTGRERLIAVTLSAVPFLCFHPEI